MSLNFHNLTAISDEEFYSANAASCRREADARRQTPGENQASIADFFEKRAKQYEADLREIKKCVTKEAQ